MKLLKRLPVLAPHSAPASATPRSLAPCQSGPRRLLSLLSDSGGLATRLATFTAAILFGLPQVQAVDYHVTTAQELQNALTSAAANGADDNIYLAAGYYTGNFNFNSTENRSLLLQGEVGTTNTQITIDGAATGRDMNLANTGTGNFTVRGITFLRNCGSASIGALRIAGGTGSTLLVDSCRFLSGTNASLLGIGLEIVSGQHATVTNCVAIGRASGGGDGVQIGVAGNIAVAGCVVATNSGFGVYGSGGGTLTIAGNTFTGNSGAGASVSCSGGAALVNNIFIGNPGGGADLGSGGGMLVANNVFNGNNGFRRAGGCTASASGILTVSNNVFAGNASRNPGGGPVTGTAAFSGGSVALIGNSFTGNSAGTPAVSCGSPATITGNTFSGNTSDSALNSSAPATISGNTFSGNTGYFGALTCNATATVKSNTFVGNSAFYSGAGAYFDISSGTVTVSGNVFRQNSAAQYGGAIYARAPVVALIDNLVVKNSQTGSAYQGGGIYVNASSTLTMVNNTVSDNNTAGNGGGLACLVSGVTEVLNVYNNIIWGNSASGNGADVWLAGTGSKKTFLYNDVHGMYGVWDIAANLLDVAPAFFDPVNGDYHLRSTSPCINAGTNGVPSMPAFDLDGNTRTNGAYVDLGCYEFNNTLFHPADLNHDWVISLEEYTNYATAWKNSQTWSVAPAQIAADYVTRAGYLQNLGGTYHNDGAGAPLCWKTGP